MVKGVRDGVVFLTDVHTVSLTMSVVADTRDESRRARLRKASKRRIAHLEALAA